MLRNGTANGHGHEDPEKRGLEEQFYQLERIVTAHGHLLNSQQPAFPKSGVHRRLALPIPLGSFSIGATTWLLGLLMLKTRGTTLPNAWLLTGIPMGFFFLLLSGIGELFSGNTFGCSLFISVAGIIGGLIVPFLPWTSVKTGVSIVNEGNASETMKEIHVAAGIYLLVIFGILVILLIGAQKTAVAFITAKLWICTVVVVFGIGNLTGNEHCLTAAGVFLLVASVNLFYNGTALLLLEVGHPFGRYMKLGSLAKET